MLPDKTLEPVQVGIGVTDFTFTAMVSGTLNPGDDLVIGQAKPFDTMDEVYDFPAPGSYTIRFSAPGYKDQQFIVTVAENAKEEIARLDVKLAR